MEGYPDKMGVSLYDTEVTENPLLGQQRDFKSFTLMFLQRLYARKESYLVMRDFDSILKNSKRGPHRESDSKVS